ncbi:MAG TPA: SprT family zinc-dependent metalloprotease, partial [Planctomycetota bacterium]|nr:SprT family zinc-dependent metalloprotease [Planctomycetota bacterium]
MTPLTPHGFLGELRARGADGLRRVVFRETRSTIFSLTRHGQVLNLNAAFAAAPPELLDAFAVVATAGPRRTRAYEHAVRAIRDWPPLAAALETARARHGTNGNGRAPRPAPCCGTPEQRAYLRELYLRLNHACFAGRLPPDIPLRLSDRMRRRLGQIRYDDGAAERAVLEIALNVDLMLRPNDRHRLDTMLHEMAHAEAYLLHGERGHGPRWRHIARRVGCEPRACSDVRIARRRRRGDPVTRVPPLEQRLPGGGPLPPAA